MNGVVDRLRRGVQTFTVDDGEGGGVPYGPDIRRANADMAEAADHIERLEADCRMKDELLNAAVDDYNTAKKIQVRALEWQMETVDGTIWTGVAPMSGQYLVKYNGSDWETVRGMLLVGVCETRDDAKSAAQNDYETRIKSAIVQAIPATSASPPDTVKRGEGV